MTRFLLDANLSPETARYLADTFGFDAVRLQGEQSRLPDEEVVRLAKQQGRTAITFDLDFGEIYHLHERGTFGVIVLRLDDQTVEAVNRTLGAFFSSGTKDIDLEQSLVVL